MQFCFLRDPAQINRMGSLSSAWRQCPILFYQGLGTPYSPPLTPANPVTLPPPPSLPAIILATFPHIQWALTKKLSGLSGAASADD